jgi:hypothetical protein
MHDRDSEKLRPITVSDAIDRPGQWRGKSLMRYNNLEWSIGWARGELLRA